jgi:processive 1,2-diacylglycerol beta-glucosyltransferase
MSDNKAEILSQKIEAGQNRPKKIFLLYASAGAGHRSACSAIMQSIKNLQPDADVRMVDVLDYMPKPIARLYSGGYILVVGKFPMLWYFIYESGSDLSTFKPVGFWQGAFWHSVLIPLFNYLKKEKPDQIVSSHFLSSWAAGNYKLKNDSSCTVSTVVTDYGIHPVWVSSGQDYVFVATEQLRAELLPYSDILGTSKIESVGIPIHPSFGQQKEIEALKKKYQLDPQKRTILILGGMFGSRNIRDILYWLGGCRQAIQIIVVAGKNYPVPEKVKERLVENGIKYQFFGYVDFMDDLMAVSDIAITKAGALTTSECLANGLPLVIFRPYPGQEVRNCDYFLEQGVAVRVDQLSGLCQKIGSILGNPDKLASMSARARAVARPESSESIARILLNHQVNGDR